MMPIADLIQVTKGKELVLFGELHGTREIPLILSRFFSTLAKVEDFDIALEIPASNQDDMNNFLLNGNESHLHNLNFFRDTESSDGRNSLEYLNLIKKVYLLNKKYGRNISVYCIDIVSVLNGSTAQEEKENELAKNIINIFGKKRLFVILGNVHASRKVIEVYKQKIVPAGYILSQHLTNLVSIRFCPKKGSFFNGSKKTVNSNDNSQEFDDYFDHTIHIEKVNPCSFLHLLPNKKK